MAEAYGSEQVARDDDHLRSLGIKPELTRTLGFLSSFAVAFSYISVSTGTFTTFSTGLGVAGPVFFWAWPVVVIGQLFVALNFAELASHFPVAGSIYQWSKRLSNRSLGWFTGWIYFWAGILTVTAVAVTVPLVLAGLYGFDLASPDPLGITNMQTFLAIVILITTTVINAFGVRLLTLINNIGVAAEIAGMLVFALILLVFANHQSPAILFDSRGLESAANGNVPAIFLVGMFMALFVVYGFDTAGTFGEETVDAARQAPRGILSAIGLSGIVGAIFLLGIILSFQNVDAQIKTAQAFGFPIADTLKQNLTAAVPGTGITFGEIYLVVIAIAVYVCLLAIQGATTRLMFSMGRDRRLPFSSTWAHVHPTFRTPTWAAIAVGVLAAIPFVLAGPGSAAILAISATGLIYLSYFLCNLGVFVARTRGWPHKGAWFSLGSWGTIINLVALLWGGAMIINIGLWESSWFGDFGNSLRSTWSNPLINTFLSFGGKPLDWLPPVPLFEAVVGIIVIVGAAYYAIGERGHIDEEAVEADLRTGEATIG